MMCIFTQSGQPVNIFRPTEVTIMPTFLHFLFDFLFQQLIGVIIAKEDWKSVPNKKGEPLKLCIFVSLKCTAQNM